MLNQKLLAALSLGLLTAACAGPYDRQAPLPPSTSRAPTMSERNCVDYGFTPGSAGFDRCVQGEARARAAGRVNRDYAEARLVDDSRTACLNYGLPIGTQRYDNCVSREIDARRYRDQGQIVVPQRSYAPNYDSPTRGPTPSYVEDRVGASSGPVYRDEFGFRYDSLGNRLDRNGNIISPQSTTR